MHAYLNVEYAWLRPYGWIESIQHWPTMWHMEHTAAEEWAGNFDRVRECLRSQMKNIFESGAEKAGGIGEEIISSFSEK